MTALNTSARRRIAAGFGKNISSSLADFLVSGEGLLTSAKPHREHAGSALERWSVREANTAITGVRIEGIQELVSALRSLDPKTVLERYDHQHGRALLTVYRDSDSKRPIGFQYVKTPNRQTKTLLRQLGVTSYDAPQLASSLSS